MLKMLIAATCIFTLIFTDSFAQTTVPPMDEDRSDKPTYERMEIEGSTIKQPTFMTTVKDGDNYYGFVVNNGTNALVRLDYGNSLLNHPVTAVKVARLPALSEGIQVVRDMDGWHVIVVGGMPGSFIMKIDLGPSIKNISPVVVNWGNVGDLNFPTDLHVFKENGNWYGLTINYAGNSLTRFSFGVDFNARPDGMNLGNIGSLNKPTGFAVSNAKGNWHLFITNEEANSISRLDFGNSLLGEPQGETFTYPQGLLRNPRDICIMNDGTKLFALVVNHYTTRILRFDFDQQDLTAYPKNVSSDEGSVYFPISISSFMEGGSLYALITNYNTKSVTRMKMNPPLQH